MERDNFKMEKIDEQLISRVNDSRKEEIEIERKKKFVSDYAERQKSNLKGQKQLANWSKNIPNFFVHNYEEQFGKNLKGMEALESIYS
jgi:hypothetical protein